MFQVKTALMYDAVNLFAAAVKDLHATSQIHQKRFYCEDENPEAWKHGLRIVEYMKVVCNFQNTICTN